MDELLELAGALQGPNDGIEEIPLFGEDDFSFNENEESTKSSSKLSGARLELDGVLIEEELIFIKDSCDENPSEESLPLYIIFGTEKVLCGYLKLCLKSILDLRFLGNNKYIINLIDGEDVITLLTMESTELDVMRLLNFIKVR